MDRERRLAVRTVPQMPENRTAGLFERAIAPRNTVAGGVKIMSREARAEQRSIVNVYARSVINR